MAVRTIVSASQACHTVCCIFAGGTKMTMPTAEKIGLEWSIPVAIRIGYGASELVRGPAQACDYLARRWPFVDGIYHELAERKCRAAMERKASNEEARDVFISAAIEAYVLA